MSQIRLIAVSGSIPTVNQLAVGDIAVNSYDGKAFLKKVVGNNQTVIEIGSGITPASASYALTASFAATASYFSGSVTNAVSASYALSASYADSSLNAQDVLIYVKNQSGNDIAKGVVVHITASGNSSDIPRIITASYENDNNSANTLGITNQIITNGSEGYVMTEGVLKGIDTNAFVSGQLIYLGPTGSITGSAPRAPLHAVRLGQVVREQSNNGSIYVRIDNGYELGELHDVLDNTTSGSYGDLLIKSGSLWINSKQLTGSYGLTGSLTATSFTGSFSGSGTITSASFAQTASYLNPLAQTVRLTGSLVVTGSIIISGSGTLVNIGPASFTGSAGTGSALAIYKSGSNVLSIDGSSGRLFSVDDSLSGSLFSVNTAAGLPVIEAFSDNTVNIGKYGSYPLSVSGSTLRATGSFTGSFIGNLSGSASLTSLTASGALINGNVTINGTASISFLNVSIESASVIYSTGSNQLGDAANDTQTLYGSVIIPTGSLIVSGALQVSSSVDSYLIGAGRVGIGTASPQRELHVDASGSANTDLPLALTSVDTNNRVGILFGSSSLASGRQHKLFHRVNSPTVEWLLVTNAGETGTWKFQPRDDSNYALNILTPYNGGTALITTGLSQSLFSLGAGNAGAQHLNISSSGYVGIGTTSPSEKLQVIGNIRVQSSLTDTAVKDFSLVQGHYTNAQASLSIINTVANATQNIIWIGGSNASYNAATDIRFFTAVTNTTLTGTERMRIASDGNVGIGTTSPTNRLQVKGSGTTSATTALRVENSSATALLTVADSGKVETLGFYSYPESSSISIGTNSTTYLSSYKTSIVGSVGIIPTTGNILSIGTVANSSSFQEGTALLIDSRNLTIGSWDNTRFAVGTKYNHVNNVTTGDSIEFIAGATSLTNGRIMFISASGNVGVNTIIPSYNLDVSGSGRFTNGLNVTGSTTVAGIITQLDTLNALPAYYQIINLPSSIPGGGGAPTSLISIPSGQPVSMFVEYQIINTATMTDQRSGTIMANFNSSGTPTSTFTETVTADIGNTSGVVFTTNVGAFYDIQATNAGATPYTFKAILRYF